MTIAALVGVVVLLAWFAAQVLMLAFAAAIVATLLRALAELLTRVIRIQPPWSLSLAILIIVAVVGGFAFLFGVQTVGELSHLIERLPDLINEAGARIGLPGLGAQANNLRTELLQGGGIFNNLAGYTTNALGVISSAVIVLVGGIYMALDAHRYHDGILLLIPQPHRAKGRQVLSEIGRVLRLWLLGQLVAMLAVGGTTTIGLYLLGVPSPLALGVLTGLLEFIPFIGPILAYIVALLLALTMGLSLAFWVSLLYLFIQQLESNLLIPVIQKRTVDLPPALGLFSLVAIGAILGPTGFLFGVPLTVVVIVAVKQLYIRDVLNEETTIPGEHHEEADQVEAEPTTEGSGSSLRKR